ncbi:MAG: DUF5615 family PIN-like protein, partial [Cyanobium sp.]
MPSTVLKMQCAGQLHCRRTGEFAAENDYAIVTKEDDFRALSLLHGAPPKTIWLVVGNISTAKILRILMAHITAIEAF